MATTRRAVSRYRTSIHYRSRADWSAEKNGPITAPSGPVSYLSESVAGCSQCTDCGEMSFPCRCCLECGRVQSRVLRKHERCDACTKTEAA